MSKTCLKDGLGSNCGVGPVVTQSQQNNSPVQAKQVPASSENLNDDPKVFGGSSSPIKSKINKWFINNSKAKETIN